MIENLYGTFTFGLIIASIAILVSLVIFQYILWPILKLILTPMIGGALIIGEFFGKAFEKTRRGLGSGRLDIYRRSSRRRGVDMANHVWCWPNIGQNLQKTMDDFR